MATLEQKRKNRQTYMNRVLFGGMRVKALERDGYTCRKCGMTNEQHIAKYRRSITVDHIDGQGCNSIVKNNDLENLMTLCLSCHGKKDRYRGVKRPVVNIRGLKDGFRCNQCKCPIKPSAGDIKHGRYTCHPCKYKRDKKTRLIHKRSNHELVNASISYLNATKNLPGISQLDIDEFEKAISKAKPASNFALK